jgi:glycine/D-amino acid oxidase-like deaminating enzyme
LRVIVVGAGIVGLSAAWALERAGHEPVLLERGPIPNPMAASHDQHRLIRLAHSAGDGRNLIIHDAYAAWDRLWADLGRSHYAETGMLLTARDPSDPSDWAVACRAGFDRTGTPYEIWDRGRLARRCPFLALTDRDWGLYTARGGALFADRIVHDLAALLERRGVALRPNARVAEIEPERATVTLEGGERLGADAVIVAAGGWTGKLLPVLAPRLEPRRAIVFYLEPRRTSPWVGPGHPASSTSGAWTISTSCRRSTASRSSSAPAARATPRTPTRLGRSAPTSRNGCSPACGPASANSTGTGSSTTGSACTASARTSASSPARWPTAGSPTLPAAPARCSSSAPPWASSSPPRRPAA